jgi:alkylated DNA repair dioxygenase AlkB
MQNCAPKILYEERFALGADALFPRLVAETKWDHRMRARMTASFGRPYNYSGITYSETPMPPDLQRVCEAICDRVGFLPNNCLVNYYPDGTATMGFHHDSITDLEPATGVAIVSLGAARTLTFRRRDDRSISIGYVLSHGSLLYMPPEVQLEWEHGVRGEPGAAERISLTFRRLITPDQPDVPPS